MYDIRTVQRTRERHLKTQLYLLCNNDMMSNIYTILFDRSNCTSINRCERMADKISLKKRAFVVSGTRLQHHLTNDVTCNRAEWRSRHFEGKIFVNQKEDRSLV